MPYCIKKYLPHLAVQWGLFWFTARLSLFWTIVLLVLKLQIKEIGQKFLKVVPTSATINSTLGTALPELLSLLPPEEM